MSEDHANFVQGGQSLTTPTLTTATAVSDSTLAVDLSPSSAGAPASPSPLPPPHYGPAFRAICSHPWAITPQALQVMLSIASREQLFPEALLAAQGRPLDNTRQVSLHNGVAVILVRGPITHHAGLFSAISGATSLDALAGDLRTALDDATVRAILLSIDSPGGEVAGTAEMARLVFEARGRKRIVAYIQAVGASGAYWIASAATEIVVASTALVGGLGVIATFPAPTDSGELEFVSSQTPKKAPDLSTERGQAQIQATVDALAAVFLQDVATYRGVPLSTVQADYGQGDVRVGAEAVAAGLADRVSTEDALVGELAQGEPSRLPARSFAAANAQLVLADARRAGIA